VSQDGRTLVYSRFPSKAALRRRAIKKGIEARMLSRAVKTYRTKISPNKIGVYGGWRVSKAKIVADDNIASRQHARLEQPRSLISREGIFGGLSARRAINFRRFLASLRRNKLVRR
jgi:hypothetical protein